MDRYVIVGPVVQPSAVGDFLARHVALRLPLGPRLLRVNVTQDPSGDEPFSAATEEPTRGITELGVDAGTVVDPQRFRGDWVYRVDSHEQMNRRRTWEQGMPSPGVKLIFAVRRSAATASEFRRAWLQDHVPLALRHHVGLCAYHTDVVIDVGHAAPPLDGFSHLIFPTEHELRARFFDDDAGRQAIEADVARFVAGAKVWRVQEYILLEPARADGS